MPATKTTAERAGNRKPVFDPARCKRCGICTHFCPFGAIAQEEDGTPYLAKPELCTSCRLCQDMCPDWAIRLTEAGDGQESGRAGQEKTQQALAAAKNPKRSHG
jgi:2-oxoglutarate ferredoxin oxidoreductase subunit delta